MRVQGRGTLVYLCAWMRCRVLGDAALLEASDMRWTLIEPTPFSRCAHAGVAMPSTSSPSEESSMQGGWKCNHSPASLCKHECVCTPKQTYMFTRNATGHLCIRKGSAQIAPFLLAVCRHF